MTGQLKFSPFGPTRFEFIIYTVSSSGDREGHKTSNPLGVLADLIEGITRRKQVLVSELSRIDVREAFARTHLTRWARSGQRTGGSAVPEKTRMRTA